jgi:hypothetical protein
MQTVQSEIQFKYYWLARSIRSHFLLVSAMETAVPVIFLGWKIVNRSHWKKRAHLQQNAFYLKNAPADLEAKLDICMRCHDIYGC